MIRHSDRTAQALAEGAEVWLLSEEGHPNASELLVGAERDVRAVLLGQVRLAAWPPEWTLRRVVLSDGEVCDARG